MKFLFKVKCFDYKNTYFSFTILDFSYIKTSQVYSINICVFNIFLKLILLRTN
jgi:hypothetical protein